jgi:hypothetical protein
MLLWTSIPMRALRSKVPGDGTLPPPNAKETVWRVRSSMRNSGTPAL